MPHVSIVVPVYNAERFIGATLASIAAQTFSNFDVYVVDDCSTDCSAAVIQRFCDTDPRFHYLSSPSNFGGPAGPRNLGVAASESEFVAFCDADDLWTPHKLELQVAVAQEHEADAVTGIARDFKEGSDPVPFQRPAGPIPVTRISHGMLLIKNWICLASVLVRRSALEAAGPFNTSRSHIAVEDYDMWLRMTGAGARFVRIAAPLVHYRKVPTSISARKFTMVGKALAIIAEDYSRRGLAKQFGLLRPIHWFLYVGSAVYMRGLRREL